MGTKQNPGAFDCYANLKPDEPYFLLMGRDKHAPALVWLWATMRELDGEDKAKVKEAQQCVESMLNWAAVQGRPSAGFGMAVLAGIMDMIRVINFANKELGEKPLNNGTPMEEMIRLYLAATRFETEKDKAADTKQGEHP